MIHEASLVAFGPRVNDAILEWKKAQISVDTSSNLLIKRAAFRLHLLVFDSDTYFVQCKHVEVADVILLSVPDPGAAFFFIYHLAHVFTDKSSLGETKRDGETEE